MKKPDPLVPYARKLRKTMTKPEVLLWLDLRMQKPLGFRFRRQVPIMGFIVDFACYTSRIVVEVDGFQHGFDCHQSKDAVRDKALERAGFHVLRFTNGEVLENRAGVLESILASAPARLAMLNAISASQTGRETRLADNGKSGAGEITP